MGLEPGGALGPPTQLWALVIQGHLAVPSALQMALRTPGKLSYFSEGQSGYRTMSQT